MKGPVVIFGANGFLGRYLSHHFLRKGREVVAIARSREGVAPEAMFLEWDGRSAGPWALALEGAALVINLAGRSVDCRYDPDHRREILESRVGSTQVIGQAIRDCRIPPATWMNASTATWYRHAEDGPQDEWDGEPGDGFSCEVARAWEEAFFGAPAPAATRKLALRIGMVLANEEGTVFDKLAHIARCGLGGRMGKGRQRVSWIHMHDFIAAIEMLESAPLIDGVVNVTSPDSPANHVWMRRFREAVAMPVGLPAPAWAVRLGARVLGTEGELVMKSRWVRPRRLEEMGFRWRFPNLVPALEDLVAREGIDGFFEVPARRALGVRPWTPGRRLKTA